MIKITKRDGSIENFNINKIENAIRKACNSVRYNEKLIEEVLQKFKNNINIQYDLTVEEIQELVECFLMDFDYFDAAKSYIRYRDTKNKHREHAKKNIEFIKNFVKSDNAANATIDDNSNVGTKGIAVLNAEIHKEDNKNTNLELWGNKVHELYPELTYKDMINDFNTIMYAHDSSSQVLMPYCMAVTMYPFLIHGLEGLGGKSATPKNLDSFCGIYVNLVFALASEVKGAVATPEFLLYMDYFCKKEWGDYYYLNSNVEITKAPARIKTIGSQIDQYFQQVTYSINQVASSRGAQSPFTNFSFFDKYFFEGMFGDFVFPDGTKPIYESVDWLQKRYLHWLNQERLKCMLTFPVCSVSCLTENGDLKDKEMKDFICQEYSEGNSFFTYLSDSIDSLSSCCRLKNAIQENTFNYTNGMVGIQTGSKNVITLNLNRIIQECVNKEGLNKNRDNWTDSDGEILKEYLISILDRVYKYHTAYNELLHWAKDNNLFMAYNDGFINLDKQYLTIGISGLNQAAEFLGIECTNNIQYKEFCKLIFGTIKEENTKHRTKRTIFNTEQVPAESAAIKLYNRDKKDNYWVPEDTNLYASYIFKPNDECINVLDKIILHSKQFALDYLDGGASCHINLKEHLNKEQYEKLIKWAAIQGCNYFTFNIPNSECEDCGYITKYPINECPKCGSNKISFWDRIIGYMTKINNWSKGRQEEQKTRYYA